MSKKEYTTSQDWFVWCLLWASVSPEEWMSVANDSFWFPKLEEYLCVLCDLERKEKEWRKKPARTGFKKNRLAMRDETMVGKRKQLFSSLMLRALKTLTQQRKNDTMRGRKYPVSNDISPLTQTDFRILFRLPQQISLTETGRLGCFPNQRKFVQKFRKYWRMDDIREKHLQQA